MYAQKNFILEIFPYVATFESWANVMTANGQASMNNVLSLVFMTTTSFGSAHFSFDT